tara:strand:+ start:20380 stop:21609 length:1230 start_codon:yes stop_codon:yes gene_type:complete
MIDWVGVRMSNGGLLQKAIEAQKSEDEVVVEAVVKQTKNRFLPANSLWIGIGLGLLSTVLAWFFSDPQIQSDFAFILVLPLMISTVAFWMIWESIDRKFAGPIAAVLILLLASPFAAMSISSSSITITDSELSSDSQSIELKIRESGGLFGSISGDASVSVTYDGDEVWNGNMPFSVNRNDGFGKYGVLTLNVVDIYTGNADDNNQYVVSVDVAGTSDSFILDANHLQRTVTSVENEVLPAMGTGNDCDGGHDNCVIGVGLKSWIGLQTLPGNPPAPLAYADFTLNAVMSKSGTNAIEYPTVTVVNGQASWDSDSGTYGSGMGTVGDFGSLLTLDGSVEDFSLNMYYIPRDDWSENDYGCYEFQVSVTQSPPWGDRTAHVSTTYYELAEEGGDDGAPNTDESWTQVNGC